MSADRVWIFTGGRRSLPGGVFTERARAEEWIARHRLSGTLTAYPVDTGVWDWAVAQGRFRPQVAYHSTADFIANFSAASLEHHRYEDGRRTGASPAAE